MITEKNAPRELMLKLSQALEAAGEARRAVQTAVLPVPEGSILVHGPRRGPSGRYIVRGCEIFDNGNLKRLHCQRIKKNRELGDGRSFYTFDFPHLTLEEAQASANTGVAGPEPGEPGGEA